MKNPYEELVKRVFDKAKSKGGSKTKNGQATHLSTIFTEDYKHPISVRTFTTIYNFYLLKDTSRSVTLKIELLDLVYDLGLVYDACPRCATLDNRVTRVDL